MKTHPAKPSLAKLEHAAREAAGRSYAPYSEFRVGAAIWTDRGLFTGGNVENASYGLTICAERSAVFAAVSAGARRVECVAVYTPTPGPTAPCGACRQVLYEFGPAATLVSCCDGPEKVETTIDALLPGAFGPADLGIDPAAGAGAEMKTEMESEPVPKSVPDAKTAGGRKKKKAASA